MGILDVIIQVVKEQKGVFIGIIIFGIIIGALIGFMKKKDIKIIELDPKRIYRESILNKISSQKTEEEAHNENIDKAVESSENYPNVEKNQPLNEKINPQDQKKTEPEPLNNEPYRSSFSDSKIESEKPMDLNIDQALEKNKEMESKEKTKTQKSETKNTKKASESKEIKKEKKPEPQTKKEEQSPQADKTEKKPVIEDKNSILNLEKIPQKNKVEVYKK